jgi:hypothetical protein
MQGECRCWKTPRCHHHNQFTHIIAYIVLLVDDAENRRLLPSTLQWQIFISSHVNTCRGTSFTVLCFHSLNFEKFHIALGCEEDVDAELENTPLPPPQPISTWWSSSLLHPLSTTPNTDDPPGEHHTRMHLRDHPKSCMHICLVPHNVCQWLSRELASLEELSQSEVRKRSGTNVGIRCCYFAKLKH